MPVKVVTEGMIRQLEMLDNQGDNLHLRRAYVDVCGGDHVAALILAQLLYYHLPDRQGKGTKLRVCKNGYYWVAKNHKDWWNECRVNEHTARKKINFLVQRGLVVAKNHLFNGIKTQHLRLNFDCLEAHLEGVASNNQIRSAGSNATTPNVTNRFELNGHSDSAGQIESKTETTSQTTPTEKNPPPFADAKGVFPIFPGLKNIPPEALEDVDGDDETQSAIADHLLGANPGSARQASMSDDQWIEAVTRDHAESAHAFSTILPDPNNPLTSPETARKFVKHREGILGGNAALLLARWFPNVSVNGQESSAWKKGLTFTELLDDSNLQIALQACRSAAMQELQCLESLGEDAFDTDSILEQIQFMECNFPEGNLLNFAWYELDLLALAYVAYLRRHPELAAFQEKHREEILQALAEGSQWTRLTQCNQMDTEAVWGIPMEEVRLAQEQYFTLLETEKKKIEQLLR